MKSHFQNIEVHLLQDEQPSLFLEDFFSSEPAKNKPFSMLNRLKDTEQSPIHHPEGNAWVHTLLVVNCAAKKRDESKEPRTFMWAALLHDIGKPDTTKRRKGRITSYDHDKVGAKLAEEFLRYFTDEEEFIQNVCNLVRYHMNILYVVKNLPYQDRQGIRQHTDIEELALLGFADRMGRTNADVSEVKRTIQQFKRMMK